MLVKNRFRIAYSHIPDSSNFLTYKKNRARRKTRIYSNWDFRAESYIHLLDETINFCEELRGRNFDIRLFASDKPPAKEYCSERSINLCSIGECGHYHYRLFSDFVFDRWPETGIDDYSVFTKELSETKERSITNEKLFWIGANLCKSREKAYEISKGNDLLDINFIDWSKVDPLTGKPIGFQEMSDLAQNLALLDLEGVGYSGRTKLLLFIGRPVVIQEPKYKEFWFDDLEPWVNYIPLKHDLSDLSEIASWIKSNSLEALKIGEKGRSFAIENLSREKAIEYNRETLLNILGDL